MSHLPLAVLAVLAVAAGAILTMVVDTMVPEAFEGIQDYAGIIAVSGFLAAFALSKMARSRHDQSCPFGTLQFAP